MAFLEIISSFLLTASQVMNIPEEYQFPALVLLAVVAVFLILGAGLTVQQQATEKSDSKTKAAAPSTPTRPRKGKESLGTVTTPSGRRSARLASRRKED